MKTSATTPRKQQPANLPPYAHLSFVRGKPTRYGWTGENWFAVPEDKTGDDLGRAGLLAFQELQQYVKANGGNNTMNHLIVQWALQDAFKTIGSNNGKDRDGSAAFTFIRCVAEFASAMMASDTVACVAWMLDQNQRLREDVRVLKAERRDAFTERMQAARAAKRAARQALADAGAASGQQEPACA